MQTIAKIAVTLVLMTASTVGRAQAVATNGLSVSALLPSAEKGNVEAEHNLGMLYLKQGTGAGPDFAKAIPWLIKAADANQPHANLVLGQLYSAGQGVPKDDAESAKRNKRAEALYQTAANRRDVKAQVMLGDMYFNGWGVAMDKKAAIGWYTQAATNGSTEVKTSLGCAYLSTGDFTNAAKWLKQGAEAGDLKAQSNLGQLYLKGVGVAKDTAQGIKWARLAAEKGDPTAQSNLGVCYRDGVGVEKDQKQADEWFAKARAPRPQM